MLKLALIHYLYFLKLIVLQQSHCRAFYVLVINMNLPLQLCFKCRSKVLLISLKIFLHNVTLVVCRVIMLILVYLQYTKCIFIRSVTVSNINNRQPSSSLATFTSVMMMSAISGHLEQPWQASVAPKAHLRWRRNSKCNQKNEIRGSN